jgi:hypothetical protein
VRRVVESDADDVEDAAEESPADSGTPGPNAPLPDNGPDSPDTNV